MDGLDPVMRRQVWSLLMGDVAERGTTVNLPGILAVGPGEVPQDGGLARPVGAHQPVNYEALEQEGYACSVPGKGSFAALPQDVTDKRREELLEKLDAIVQELVYLGLRGRPPSAWRTAPGRRRDRSPGRTASCPGWRRS